ncbi:MAG: hypothetical protein JWN78_3096 [Bacteroidota bacterium]|nr:hypothetical protein [Bacteroidota bacterium]
MTELIKKFIYTSIGVATITNEKFKELVEDLIQNSQFTEEEGKRIVDSFLFDVRQQVDSINANIQVKADDLFQRSGIPAIQDLKNNIENYIRDIKENPSLLLKHSRHK